MADKITGHLEVGTNDNGEVVINHPDLKPDENGVGHIVFSPDQARNLARLLLLKAGWCQMESAPRDGSRILLRSVADEIDMGPSGIVERPPMAFIGTWNPEGDSWVDETGSLNGETDHLAITGTWDVNRGWLQPNEVDGWLPLPRA